MCKPHHATAYTFQIIEFVTFGSPSMSQNIEDIYNQNITNKEKQKFFMIVWKFHSQMRH